MAAGKILIIDDDQDLSEAIEKKLTNEGFEVATACDGSGGLAAVLRDEPDLVILDLMLPDLDGLTICRRLREISNVYILILTAKTEEIDEIMGLELGADDYVTKPFSPRALSSRIRSLLRRALSEDSTNGNGRKEPRAELGVNFAPLHIQGTESEPPPPRRGFFGRKGRD